MTKELTKFLECGGDKLDPVEALRFYCSLTMTGGHWFEVEKMFDKLEQRLQQEHPVSPFNGSQVKMRKHTQRFVHDPDSGQYGDCVQASLACIMGLELDEVPVLNGESVSGAIQRDLTREFLKSKGYRIITMAVSAGSTQEVLNWVDYYNPGAVYMLSGVSVRGFNHVVVCRGREFYHDPHPSRDFLCGPMNTGVYEVEFVVPRQEYVE